MVVGDGTVLSGGRGPLLCWNSFHFALAMGRLNPGRRKFPQHSCGIIVLNRARDLDGAGSANSMDTLPVSPETRPLHTGWPGMPKK